jgi:Zn-dependent peptidase ImmA (M78 family)
MAMLAVLDRKHPGARERLHVDPLAELEAWPDVRVLLVPDTAAGQDCSVAGGYRYDTTPPTLLIAESASHRRRAFTALHELGHHLQKNDLRLATRSLDPRDGEAVEEAACDAFAGQVLLPDDLVERHIGPRGPAASDVVALYTGSGASRAACCVRAAERLSGLGAVVLLEPDGRVSFAAAKGFVPPARGSDQSGSPLIRAALARDGQATGDSVIHYRDGSTSDLLYGDCVWCDGYLVAVLVTDRAAWKPFAPPRPGTAQRRSRLWICETCQDEFTADGPPCPRCRQPRCPHGHCGCTTAAQRLCQGCYLGKHVSQFAGSATHCRDCRP